MSLSHGKITKYVVSYDIESDRIRNKIAKTLEGYGKRVQYSVFECDIEKRMLEELYEKLLKLMEKEETGNIRIYPICKNCQEKIMTIGVREREIPELEEDLFII